MQPTQTNRTVYKVSDLARRIRVLLEREIGPVWVEGEISNLSKPASGHLYFTLKDESAQIGAVFFRGAQQGMTLDLKAGLKIRVFGQATFYETQGKCQIVVQKVEEAGKGDLQAAFEALKKKLEAEGLFDRGRKKPLPMFPRRLGVVTSPTGAVIRDILNILGRRFPNLHILIAPVKVQGDGAAQQIAHALDHLNQRGGLDAIIVARGGGSIEDLWCFNEEIVARAVARSTIPVISAVGHETDFTICDFVADLRAPTPSAAAELVIRPKAEFEAAIAQHARRLVRALQALAMQLRNRYIHASRSPLFREPQNLVRQHAQRVETLGAAMKQSLRRSLEIRQQRVDELQSRKRHRIESALLECRNRFISASRSYVFREPQNQARQHGHRIAALRAALAQAARQPFETRRRQAVQLQARSAQRMAQFLSDGKQGLKRLSAQLKALSPMAVLDRGFSITSGSDGKILRDVKDVALGATVTTRLARGELEAKVSRKEE